MPAIDLTPPDQATIDRTVRRFIDAVRAEYSERLRGVFLFGSRARGDNEPDSDVDIALVLAGLTEDRAEVQERLSKLAYPLLIETGAFIDAHAVSEEEWKDPLRHYNPVLVEEMQSDASRIDLI